LAKKVNRHSSLRRNEEANVLVSQGTFYRGHAAAAVPIAAILERRDPIQTPSR
jgi:hypothetical protein